MMSALTIKKIQLDGVGPFEDATIDLDGAEGRIVLFEGPNGSGKSTIIQTIAASCAEASDPLYYVSSDKRRFFRFGGLGADDQEALYLQAFDPAGAVVAMEGLRVRTWKTPRGNVSPYWTSLNRVEQREQTDPYFVMVEPSLEANRARDDFERACRDEGAAVSWAAFGYRAHQSTPEIRTAGPRQLTTPPLRGALGFGDAFPMASDLGQLLTNLENERTKASTYAREAGADATKNESIAQQRKQSIHRFERAISSLLDRDVSISFVVDQQSPIIRFDGEVIPLEALGEGLRSSIAWLGDLLVRLERTHWKDPTPSPLDQHFWLILDEVDESLHPKMQARLYPALLELFPKAHIFASTHSPFVVASLGKGVVVPIRPEPKSHRVRGNIATLPLEPGQSLELVVRKIFDADAGVIDRQTRTDLADHKSLVTKVRRGVAANGDWPGLLALRERLYGLNDEIRAIVAMQELPIRTEIERRASQAPDGEAKVP